MAQVTLTTDEVHDTILNLWARFDTLSSTADAEQTWADEFHVDYPLAEKMLKPAKRQYLGMIRNRLMDIQNQTWIEKGAIYDRVPESYDVIDSFLGWLNIHNDLIDYAVLDQELHNQFIDSYRTLAANTDDSAWWMNNQNAVAMWFNGHHLGASPSTKIEALDAISRGEDLDTIMPMLGDFSKDAVSASNAEQISYYKLAIHAYQAFTSAQYVNQLIATTLINKFGKYARDAQIYFDDLIDQLNQSLAKQLVSTYYPNGIDDPDAAALESQFFDAHVTLSHVKNAGISESRIILDCEQLGATGAIKTHFIEDLNNSAEVIIENLYDPDLTKQLISEVDFNNAIDGCNTQELSELIALFASSGVRGIAKRINKGVEILEGNAEITSTDSTFVLTALTQQQGDDWDTALNLILARYQLSDYSDEIETDLYPLSQQLNQELGVWLGQHSDEIKQVRTMSELNQLLVQNQPQFINANIIASRMIANRNWSSLKAAFMIRFSAQLSVMDSDFIIDKLIDDKDEYAKLDHGDLAEKVESLMRSNLFEPDIQAYYADSFATLEDFNNAESLSDATIFEALGPSAWMRFKAELERMVEDD